MLSYFKKPTPRALMMSELEEAQRLLLVAQTGREWADAQVAYNQTRVARLTAAIALTDPDNARRVALAARSDALTA